MKSSASESKPFQSRSKGEIPGRARRKEPVRPFQIETCVRNWFTRRTFHVLNSQSMVRFGSWKVRRLISNRKSYEFAPQDNKPQLCFFKQIKFLEWKPQYLYWFQTSVMQITLKVIRDCTSRTIYLFLNKDTLSFNKNIFYNRPNQS